MSARSRVSVSGAILAALLTTTSILAFVGPASVLAQQSNPSSRPPSATTPASDRVELILTGLPPQSTKEYRALFARAGRGATRHVLELTRCEVWHVDRAAVAELTKAASLHKVTVAQLDERWNEMFAAPGGAPMAEGAKAMMDRAMQSKATAGMGVMSARAANRVEYALTKGMHDPQSDKEASTIKIAVNADKTLTIVRRDVRRVGDRYVWRGVVEGTESPVTILWWGNGRLSGTINTGDRLYQLRWLENDTIGIVESVADRMPDEHPRTSPKRMQEMRMQEDQIFMKGDASMGRPSRNEVDKLKDDSAKSNGKAPATKAPSDTLRSRVDGKAADAIGPATVIDVMVVHTAKAALHYGDIRRDLIELSIEETNQSLRASRVEGLEVRLVHVHQTDYDEAGAEHFDHVWRMADKGDGFMEEVPPLRDAKKADVVVLVVDDPSGCGLATRVAADAEEAYAVVHHECAATSYSIAHEIGHILGARHDRLLDHGGAPFDFGHGYVSPDLKWRTLMSYKAGCRGCPRLPIWSTPEPVMNGKPAGDALHDNARVIREQAGRVAGFR